ncbi:MAG: hypothetical protein DRI32_07115, partial [Chloroflexi bacterium]
MDNRKNLENLIVDFSSEKLSAFFRLASGGFRPQDEDFGDLLNDESPLDEMRLIGGAKFDDNQMVFVVGHSPAELTSRSGKLKQYFVAKEILKRKDADAGIFVYYDDGGHFRFSLVVAQYQGTKQTFTNFRRYTYFISPDEPQRTFIEQIGQADFSSIASIQKAFSVEVVTTAFFKEYEKLFRLAEASIKLDWVAEQKRLYTQKFFNRLIFLAFLERKGWLNFQGRQHDYLRALFEDYVQDDEPKRADANFHRKRLNTLFFWGLNNDRGADESQLGAFKPLSRLIGDVPYLNGGLFEQEADDEGWFFSDEIVASILKDLIYRFNFTVAESTPLDVEVAVDPEMLGKMFEELVTGRHESGSYYTPKPVVAFMCREALKGYLETALPAEDEEAIALFVDVTDAAALRDPELALAALRGVRAVDPACGSGAYLLGLLHELLDLRAALFVSRHVDAQTVYDRKLEIIQNNLYGVDLDPFAVNIARLRLWLSLIVDYEGENPPPLPNLDFKIEMGDSLSAPDPSGGLDVGFRRQLIDEFLEAKKKYTTAHGDNKISLREETNKLRTDIQNWAGHSVEFDGFDWTIEFAELFVSEQQKIGFDIVLANPPYVRADAQFKHIDDEEKRQEAIAEWKAFRERLKKSKTYETLYEKWDIYIPFLERAYQLLGKNGQMIFIIPDAYNAAKYTDKSHAFFLENTKIKRIDFCSEIDLFDAGVQNTILHFQKPITDEEHKPIRVRRWGENKDDFFKNIEFLPSTQQINTENALFRPNSSLTPPANIHFPTLEMVCYISVGMVIHADEKRAQGLFQAEDLISELQDKEHPKPYVEGKDIAKWGTQNRRFLEYGTKRAPSLFRRQTFIELHEARERLLAFRMSGNNVAVAYDDKKLMSNHTVIIGVPWSLLQGVINRSISKTT